MLKHTRYIIGDLWSMTRALFISRSLKQLNYLMCRSYYGRPRELLSALLCRLAPRPSGYAGVDVSEEVERLRVEGYALLDGVCPPELAARLFRELEHIPCKDPYRPELGALRGDRLPPETHVAQLEREALIRSKDVMDLANHPKLLAIVSQALNAKPTVLVTSWWSSFAGGEPEAAELFHRDKDDWRFLKVFIYLTDVDQRSGPHVFVPRSHAHRGLEFRRQRRYTDEEVSAFYGDGCQRVFLGPAGTTLIENTYGLHKGLPVQEGRRLMLQFTYSLFPLLYAPERPEVSAAELSGAYDPHINRVHVQP